MKKIADILGPIVFWFCFAVMVVGAVFFSVSGKEYQPLLICGTVTFFLQLGLLIWHIINDRRQHAQFGK